MTMTMTTTTEKKEKKKIGRKKIKIRLEPIVCSEFQHLFSSYVKCSTAHIVNILNAVAQNEFKETKRENCLIK